MVASLFAHDCGPYCHNGNHAVLVWCCRDLEYTPHEMLRLCCEHVGVRLVHLEEVCEPGPVPVGVAAEVFNFETGERVLLPVSGDERPYLVVWRVSDGA